MSESKYRRVVLKLSGEAFADRSISFGIDSDVVQRIAAEVTKARADLGVEIAIVVGGGNIFRGMIGATGGMDIGALVGQLVGGGVSGAIVSAIVGMVMNSMKSA